MKTNLILLVLVLVGGGARCAHADQGGGLSFTAEIRLGHRAPPPPAPVVVLIAEPDRGGPPAWARARWYQRNHGYYYYPGGDVYYRPGDGVWFYLERGEWRTARSLPDWVRVDFGHSVALTMATDRPYFYHQQIVVRYPANYFGARVRLREEPPPGREGEREDFNRDRNRDRDDRRESDKNDRGRSKGKGRDK